MRARIFEVRWRDGVYPTMALEMTDDVSESRRWLLDRAGYVKRGEPPDILLLFIDSVDPGCQIRPGEWKEAWQRDLHAYVIEHFNEIYDGKTIDVDYLRGDREAPRISSRAV